MPTSVTDTDDGRGSIIRFWGDLVEDEIVQAHEEFLDQPSEKVGAYRYLLADYSGVAALDISSAGVRKLSKICMAAATRHPDPVVASLAARDVVFGLARMFEMLSNQSPWEISVFRSRSDAVAWIRERVQERYGMDVLSDVEIEAALPPV